MLLFWENNQSITLSKTVMGKQDQKQDGRAMQIFKTKLPNNSIQNIQY